MRIAFITSILLLFSCNSGQVETYTLEGRAQGTTFHIQYHGPAAKDFKSEVSTILEEIDQSLSLWRNDSFISQVNDGLDSVYLIPDEDRYFAELTGISKLIHHESHGAFNPAIYPLVKAWGFGAKASETDSLPEIEQIFDQYSIEGFEVVIGSMGPKEALFKPKNMELDFNAIAQGYSVDIITRFLEEQGVEDYLVEIGGELSAHGRRPDGELWNIAIERPQDGERVAMQTVRLDNEAMTTSGNYRKYVERAGRRYSHTIDPRSGYPVEHQVLSATVVAKDAAHADAYATTLMVMGEKEGLIWAKNRKLDVLFVLADEEGGYRTVGTGRFANSPDQIL